MSKPTVVIVAARPGALGIQMLAAAPGDAGRGTHTPGAVAAGSALGRQAETDLVTDQRAPGGR